LTKVEESNDDKENVAEEEGDDKDVTATDQTHIRRDTHSVSSIPVESGLNTSSTDSSNSEQLQRTERLTADDETNETKNEDKEQGTVQCKVTLQLQLLYSV
jgi:hypothetical protein